MHSCAACGQPGGTLSDPVCSTCKHACLSTYNPQTHRLIPNDGSVVVLGWEDAEGIRCELETRCEAVCDDEVFYRGTREHGFHADALTDARQAVTNIEVAIRSALEQAPANAEGESGGQG